MPSEIRHILFQPPEVVQAIGAYYRRVGRAVPPGVVTNCGPERMGPDSPARFRMTIEDDRPLTEAGVPPTPGASKQSVIVDGSDLAAALILHCRTKKIPLPASATKALEVYGGQLCLAFTKTSDQDVSAAGEKLRL